MTRTPPRDPRSGCTGLDVSPGHCHFVVYTFEAVRGNAVRNAHLHPCAQHEWHPYGCSPGLSGRAPTGSGLITASTPIGGADPVPYGHSSPLGLSLGPSVTPWLHPSFIVPLAPGEAWSTPSMGVHTASAGAPARAPILTPRPSRCRSCSGVGAERKGPAQVCTSPCRVAEVVSTWRPIQSPWRHEVCRSRLQLSWRRLVSSHGVRAGGIPTSYSHPSSPTASPCHHGDHLVCLPVVRPGLNPACAGLHLIHRWPNRGHSWPISGHL